MSYPKDLDEHTTEDLKSELRKRREAAKKDLCHYCNQPLSSHTCKFSKNGRKLEVRKSDLITNNPIDFSSKI